MNTKIKVTESYYFDTYSNDVAIILRTMNLGKNDILENSLGWKNLVKEIDLILNNPNAEPEFFYLLKNNKKYISYVPICDA